MRRKQTVGNVEPGMKEYFLFRCECGYGYKRTRNHRFLSRDNDVEKVRAQHKEEYPSHKLLALEFDSVMKVGGTPRIAHADPLDDLAADLSWEAFDAKLRLAVKADKEKEVAEAKEG